MINLTTLEVLGLSLVIITCLYTCASCVKRRTTYLISKLIPLITVLVSVILTFILSVIHDSDTSLWPIFGLLYGLSSVGIYRVIDQTTMFIKLLKRNKYLDSEEYSKYIKRISDSWDTDSCDNKKEV